ncbi:putative 50S ribosomal protein L21 [Besnoitia besnoiti]|uniref:Putative 50S ribosomal protein L21 n=1 Tax=Besnoitia besnoiti TaxID=94643 RepID=A0A2A9M0V5_BESBE|nr:putative 50S ribosomal protein L21 [Besnoitia besnoiti]PFH32188.1 putative 50S ribosomal protein L21 [Besnoitia besnoiti]
MKRAQALITFYLSSSRNCCCLFAIGPASKIENTSAVLKVEESEDPAGSRDEGSSVLLAFFFRSISRNAEMSSGQEVSRAGGPATYKTCQRHMSGGQLMSSLAACNGIPLVAGLLFFPCFVVRGHLASPPPLRQGASRRRSASSSSSSVAPQPQRALFQFAATSLLSTGGASWFPSSSCLTASRLPSAYPSVASCSDPPPAALPPLETFPLFPPPHEARSKGRLPNDGEGQRYVDRGRTGRGRTGHERPETRWSTEGHPSARQNADATAEFRAGEAVWQSPAFQLEGFKGIFPVVSPAHQKLLGLADQKDRSGSFFVAHIGGTQMIMERGRFYDVNRIHQKVGGRIHLHRIICYQAPDGEFWLGRPYLENVRATATIEKHFRGPKMHMAKARPKKWRKYFSHRQDLTRIRVTEVDLLRNPEEYESATLPPNFTTDDPIYAALTASKLFRKPSTVLPRMKRTFMRLASREEFPLVGDDPLMNFDPLVNRLLMDRLLAGHSDLFPLLRPETDMKRDWH